LSEQLNAREEKNFSWPLADKELPYLKGNKCRSCGRFHFPKAIACTGCLSEDLEEIHFGQKGRLYSSSIVHVSSMGLTAPYATGYVDVDYGQRLYAIIVDWKKEDLKNGREMELVITRLREDENSGRVMGYTYRPV
jgi:uncharacterized OB-fold protein